MRTPTSLCLPALFALAVATALPAAAQTLALPDDGRGFSYFMGIGAQRTTYQETLSGYPIKSHAQATSPLLITGAVYAVGADTLVSFDSETTFAPSIVNEAWTAPVGTVLPMGGGATVTVTDPVLQTNRFSFQQNTLRLLWQQRASGPLFIVGGPAFHTQSYKRFGFRAGTDNATNIVNTTIEETASELMLNAGLALDSERLRGTRTHYSLRATVGVPVWRKLVNTAFPNNSFNGTSGFDFTLAGRYSYALHPNLHLGAWGQLQQGRRGRETQGILELPESKLQSFSYGLELLWKL